MDVMIQCQNYRLLRRDLNHFLLKLKEKVVNSMKALQEFQQDHPQYLMASCLFKFTMAKLDHPTNLKDRQIQLKVMPQTKALMYIFTFKQFQIQPLMTSCHQYQGQVILNLKLNLQKEHLIHLLYIFSCQHAFYFQLLPY